jgi:hypothetical protein
MSSIPATIRIESPFITGIAKALKIAAESTTAPAQVSNPLRASLRDSAPAAHIMYRDRAILIGDTRMLIRYLSRIAPPSTVRFLI